MPIQTPLPLYPPHPRPGRCKPAPNPILAPAAASIACCALRV